MLVSLPDLLNHVGQIQLDSNQQNHVQNVILPGVQQELEEYLGRPVEKVRVVERLSPDDIGDIYFSMTPVWRINSIVRDNGSVIPITQPPVIATPIEADPKVRVLNKTGAMSVEGGFKYNIGIYSPYGAFFGVNNAVTADYYAGLDGSRNEALKVSILDVAARTTTNLFDLTVGMRNGTIEVSPDSDSQPKHWQPEELLKWDSLRHRTAV